ncbi:coiled-coil domain-containing protein 192-like [Chiloscyllium punctatum]|uniref:coiled-coil domain-containing protein 192-like n=1 Tax=Chiloscyllium punctatum TaxID=137246 RepID=UPI003B639CD7
MGHAASANVRMISVKPNLNKPGPDTAHLRKAPRIAQANSCTKGAPNYIDDLIQDGNFTQIGSISDSSEVESELQEAKGKVRTLEKELVEVEECRLQLSEQVMWLEERLEVMRNKIKSASFYEETICVKEKYIQRLEAENKCVKEQLIQSKQKHKKIVKKMQIQLAQVKQDGAISVMEAKERIQTLEKENRSVREQQFNNKHLDEGVSRDGIEHRELGSGGENRVRLVLELSSQLSQQQEKIRLLETTLKEKEARLSGLETQLLTQATAGASANGLLQLNLPAPHDNKTCTTKGDQRLGALLFSVDTLTSDRSSNAKIDQG